jgi:hypothetical protein
MQYLIRFFFCLLLKIIDFYCKSMLTQKYQVFKYFLCTMSGLTKFTFEFFHALGKIQIFYTETKRRFLVTHTMPFVCISRVKKGSFRLFQSFTDSGFGSWEVEGVGKGGVGGVGQTLIET